MKFGLRILSFVSSLFLFIAPHVVYSQTDFFKDNVSAPLFPGCNAESCSNKELANYISSNILFPSSADPNGVLMYAGITIDENGKMQGGIKVFHSISKEADDQVYRLYGGLKNRGLWTPRTIDGGPVSKRKAGLGAAVYLKSRVFISLGDKTKLWTCYKETY